MFFIAIFIRLHSIYIQNRVTFQPNGKFYSANPYFQYQSLIGKARSCLEYSLRQNDCWAEIDHIQ
jgi:hypothetical protein